MKSVGPVREFYAFGIYGRDFNLDETDGAEIGKRSSMLLIGALAVIAALQRLM